MRNSLSREAKGCSLDVSQKNRDPFVRGPDRCDVPGQRRACRKAGVRSRATPEREAILKDGMTRGHRRP